MTPPRSSISAFIVCCNEEQQIRRCLESVRFCDEIIVVDSGSTDRTLEICKEYTPCILTRAWSGFVEQKRFGLESCTKDWVLNIDADEEVSPELKAQIIHVLERDHTLAGVPHAGYELSRVVWHLGRWWRKGGWYPEFRLRLLRRTQARWGGEDPHEKALVTGTTERLNGELRHYTYDDLADQVRSLNAHSSAAAASLCKRGERGLVSKMILNPIARFAKFYVLRRGYREGLPGLVVGIMEAVYVFLKYAKAWERHRVTERSHPTPE